MAKCKVDCTCTGVGCPCREVEVPNKSPLVYARIGSGENRGFVSGQIARWRPFAVGEAYRKTFPPPDSPWKHWPIPAPLDCRLRCHYAWKITGPDGKVIPFVKEGPSPESVIHHYLSSGDGLYKVALTITDPVDGTTASYLANIQVPTPPKLIGATNWRLYPHAPKEFNEFPWPWDADCTRPGHPHVLPWL